MANRDPMERRKFIRLLSGAVGTSVIPLNFSACGLNGAIVRNSSHIPTPEQPLTPLSDFYVNANYGLPSETQTPDTFQLRVAGLVEQERSIGFDEIANLPQVEETYTLECVGNTASGGLISSQVFRGPRLRDVLALSGVSDRARGIYLVGLDGYPILAPISVLEDDDALLVHSIAGEPLDEDHGAPLRALFPNRFGMFSVKWLDSITLVREWNQWGTFRGLSNSFDGIKRTRSRLDSPRPGREVRVGEEVTVSGLAVSSGTGIAKVEVRTELGWQEAELLFNTLTDTRSGLLWSLYGYRWTPTVEGEITLAVRATDTEGEEQSVERRFPYDGSSIHAVPVVVRG